MPTVKALDRDGSPAPEGTFGRTYLVLVTVWVTVLVWVTVTVRVPPLVGAPPEPDAGAAPRAGAPAEPVLVDPAEPDPEWLAPAAFDPDFLAVVVLGTLGAVPGELPPAGTRLGLKALVLVVELPAVVLPALGEEEAVPHPASRAAAARAAITAPERRRLALARRRRGARDWLSVSISTNDTDYADG